MVNPVGYFLREKKIPNSGLLFTGVLLVPGDCKSGNFHQKIVDTFNGRKENIKRLDNQKEMDKEWETIEDALSTNVLKREQMPKLCLDRLPNRGVCTLEEVKLLVQNGEGSVKTQDQKLDMTPKASKPKSSSRSVGNEPPAKDPSKSKSASHSVSDAQPAKDPPQNVAGASGTNAASDVFEEVSSEGANGYISDETPSQQQELFWAFIDDKGRIGEQFFFDQEVQREPACSILSPKRHPH